jgi:hypothetical protein
MVKKKERNAMGTKWVKCIHKREKNKDDLRSKY